MEILFLFVVAVVLFGVVFVGVVKRAQRGNQKATAEASSK